MEQAITMVCRAMVATALILSAGWKVQHRVEFTAAFARLAPAGLRRFAPWSLGPFVMMECLIAVLLVAGAFVPSLGLVGPAATLLLVGAFTVAFGRSGSASCGCWSTPMAMPARRAREVTLVRNALLLAAAAASALVTTAPVAITAAIAPVVTGTILGVLLVELPQLVSVATFERDYEAAQ